MKPMRAHCLSVIPRNLTNSALSVRSARSGVERIGVHGIVSRENHRPSIVIELTREEKSIGVAIALGGIVAIVLMRRQRMETKTMIS